MPQLLTLPAARQNRLRAMRCCDCAQKLAQKGAITEPQAVAHAMRRLAHREQEEFWVLLLDARHRAVRKIMIARGTVTSCSVAARDVFRDAIRQNAVALIAVHNHPSGDPTPSPDDHALTKRLVEVGRIIGVAVLDHVIVARQSFYSFADHGRLA